MPKTASLNISKLITTRAGCTQRLVTVLLYSLSNAGQTLLQLSNLSGHLFSGAGFKVSAHGAVGVYALDAEGRSLVMHGCVGGGVQQFKIRRAILSQGILSAIIKLQFRLSFSFQFKFSFCLLKVPLFSPDPKYLSQLPAYWKS